MIASASSYACPDRRCAARADQAGGSTGTAAVARTELPAPRAEAAQVAGDSAISLSFEVARGDQESTLESMTPWIWRHLRQVAHDSLPRHERERFCAVWAPVVVVGPTDTVPGVGLSGRF